MPKKFSTEHPRSTALKERRKIASDEETSKKQRQEEDAYWLDDGKLVRKKQQRKEEQERRRELQIAKRAETKLLLEKEMKNLRVGKVQVPKLTRVQIRSAVNVSRKVTSQADTSLCDNVNRLPVEGGEARSVTEAIDLLKIKNAEVDRHPEKRRKAVFSAFESRRLAELKSENPALKLSQMKQMVFKEWQRSAENPVNARQDSQ